MPATAARLSFTTKLNIATRLFAIQGAWNYESLLGNGVGFCIEPALRVLPGGRGGPAYREALARQSQYFNAHPYFAAIAVGALARAELDREPADRIERFRTALCGPLGSVGDRLVWAGWLPLCSLLALAAFGLGAGPVAVVGGFFVLYNVGHVALRLWALETGWTHGLRVAPALGAPLLRQGPEHVARAAALLAGIAIPLALQRVTGPSRPLLAAELAAVVAGAVVLARLHGRVEGWRVALGVLAGFVLFSVLRHG
jgi:PTS system mannose-specific IID component